MMKEPAITHRTTAPNEVSPSGAVTTMQDLRIGDCFLLNKNGSRCMLVMEGTEQRPHSYMVVDLVWGQVSTIMGEPADLEPVTLLPSVTITKNHPR